TDILRPPVSGSQQTYGCYAANRRRRRRLCSGPCDAAFGETRLIDRLSWSYHNQERLQPVFERASVGGLAKFSVCVGRSLAASGGQSIKCESTNWTCQQFSTE